MIYTCENRYKRYAELPELRRGLYLIYDAQRTQNFNFNDKDNRTINQFFQWFSDQFDDSNNIYTGQLKSLIQHLFEMKTFINESIDELIIIIEEWISGTFNQKEILQNNLKDIRNLKYVQFIKQANLQQKTLEKRFKNILFDKINRLLNKKWIETSLEKLKEISKMSLELFHYDSYSQFFFSSGTVTETKLNIQCQRHKKLITMMDITEKRLLCDDCTSNNPVTMKHVQNLWNNHQLRKNTQLQTYLDYQREKTQNIRLSFEQMKIVLNKSYETVFNVIDKQQSEILGIINRQRQEISYDWELMQGQNILIRAEIMSSPKTESEMKSQLITDCSKQQKKINDVTQDQMIKLQTQFQNNINSVLQRLKFHECFQHLQDNFQLDKFSKGNLLQQVNNVNYEKNQQYAMPGKYCYCACFNKDNTIIAIAYDYDIKIFKFYDGKIEEIQTLKGHSNYVLTLLIDDNNQIFSSSFYDQKTLFWVQINEKQWKLDFELHGGAYCMVFNKKENQLLLSGCTILRCLMKIQNKWEAVQRLQYHQSNIVALSINQQQNLLLSCGHDKKINIFECGVRQHWSLIQIIYLNDLAFRASFIEDNKIVFQLKSNGILRVYENNGLAFLPKQDIKVQGTGGCLYFFPQIYSSQQRILVSKNCQYINIIRMKKDDSLLVVQSIKFETEYIYGTITDDGKYLVTWDIVSKQIQVRLLK